MSTRWSTRSSSESARQKSLDIVDTVAPPAHDAANTPTDVFRSAVQANRQLNLLPDRDTEPSDVFQQVTLGVAYASKLLDRFPGATTLPEPPPFEVGKLPVDVYRRLLECIDLIRQIAGNSGKQMLELDVNEAHLDGIVPSDVYHIAALAVSELAFLHGQLADADAPRTVYYVGRKFPSHMYQRTGLLKRQLVALERLSKGGHDWLAQSP